jgi:hypothetical protein
MDKNAPFGEGREIGDDAPITLEECCAIFFRDTIRPATLRAEAARGRLAVYRVGRKDFTTIRAAREMIDLCRVEQSRPVSTFTRKSGYGSSETDRISSGLAALKQTLAVLKSV